MKKLTIILFAFTVLATVARGQGKTATPKQHVFYDTVKVVKERVDYTPDTIPIYFKEIIVSNGAVAEKWTTGFVIWQTYKKYTSISYGLTDGGYTTLNGQAPSYYKDEFEPTKFTNGQYLYEDKRKVTNRVLYTIKR